MKIERIDDKTVKCFLSNEELEEYDIDYKDFVLRSDKAKQVVQEIIEQAAEQVGYKPPRFVFDMQIMMLPDKGLLLTFSEGDSAAGQMLEHLPFAWQELKQMLTKLGEQLGIGASDEAPARETSQYVRPEQVIFVFDRLQNIMDYARVLPGNLRVRSELYEMEGAYYLYIEKGAASYERYSRICIQAMEFGRLYSAEEDSLLLIKEHGSCLVPEKVLQKLKR